MDKPLPYHVEISTEGCPTCQHDTQWDIVGPGDVAQSQTWGDREEANYVCELMNDAFLAGRASYAQQVLDTLNKEIKSEDQAEVTSPAEAPSTPQAPEDDISF